MTGEQEIFCDDLHYQVRKSWRDKNILIFCLQQVEYDYEDENAGFVDKIDTSTSRSGLLMFKTKIIFQ